MTNKFINFTLIMLLVFFVSFRISAACSELNKKEQPLQELPKTFSGTLSSDGDQGMGYYIQITEDSFTELTWHRDKSEPVTETGSWEIKGDTLFAFKEEELYKTFLYFDDELVLLDREYSAAEQPRFDRIMSEKSIRSRYAELKKEGIDFIASGNEPFWSVRIDMDSSLTYRTPEDSLFFPKPQIREIGPYTSFTVETATGSVQLQGEEKYCIDSMSGFLFTHTVTAVVQERNLSGCGIFLD